MTGLQGRYVMTNDGLPLAVYEAGRRSGPPIVFLHGFGFSHAVFEPHFNSDLAGEFRLIAMNARGHGSLAKPWVQSAVAGEENAL